MFHTIQHVIPKPITAIGHLAIQNVWIPNLQKENEQKHCYSKKDITKSVRCVCEFP